MRKPYSGIYWGQPEVRIAGTSKLKAGGSSAGSRVQAGNGAGRRTARKPEVRLTLDAVLRDISRKMTPFYRKIAVNARYARQWSEAVVALDLDRMERLLKEASPRIGENFPGTNSIGYLVEFPFTGSFEGYGNGTTIVPGTAKDVFEPQAHRAIASAVYPLYRSLGLNRTFARAVAKAIGDNDPEAAAALVRSKVRTAALKSVSIESRGIALVFRFPFSKYTYRNLLIRDIE
jgi:hypothetical protein